MELGFLELVYIILYPYFTVALEDNIYFNFFSLQITENDILQTIICSTCIKTINDMYNYRQHCINFQRTLLNQFSEKLKQNQKLENISYISTEEVPAANDQIYIISNKENTNEEIQYIDISSFDNPKELFCPKLEPKAIVQEVQYIDISSVDNKKDAFFKKEQVIPEVQYIDISSVDNLKEVCNIKPEVVISEVVIPELQSINITSVDDPNELCCSESRLEIPLDNLDDEQEHTYKLKCSTKENGGSNCEFPSESETNKKNLSIRLNDNEKPNRLRKKSLSGDPTKAERQERYKQLLRPCDICGKMVEKSRMEAHTNQHLNVRPYACDLNNCNKQFYSAYALTTHKRVHHTNQTFECKICSKTYTLQKSLYNHEQKHKAPRYTCNVCGRKYKNR